MSVKRGRDMLLKIEENDQFITVAGLRTKSLLLNSRTVDVTDQDSQGWVELLPEAGLRSVSVKGSGLFRDAASNGKIRAAFFSQEAMNAQLILPDFGTITGPFLITALTYGGAYAGEATFDVSLSSAGSPNFTAA